MFRVSSSSLTSSFLKNSQHQLPSSLIPISTRSFTVLTEEQAKKDDKHLPVFMVGYKNGFLPRQDPLVTLPKEFSGLEQLLQEMPITKKNGQPGLLAHGKFGDAVKDLPLYDVSKIDDQRILTALFRDYTFAASSYLLEPCDIMNRQKKDFGLGRDVLPKNLAVPLAKISEKISAKPFMEYAQSYSLYNYQRKDPNAPLDYSNLNLIRAFHGMPSEHGFILVHVSMVRYSGEQVTAVMNLLKAAEKKDRVALNKAMEDLLNVLKKINAVMETMWKYSKPEDYLKFRTFIMGTKNQPMFPNGVLYEGVSDQRTFYRGESGANDSIIPTTDNVLQLTASMPKNPLTDILKDFRSYRPKNHNEWLTFVENKANEVDLRSFAEAESNSAVKYLALLDQVREFRDRHWNFTKEYIIKHTDHPVATGGSPIVTWLPNQLSVVLNQIVATGKKINQSKLDSSNKILCKELIARGEAQGRVLKREVNNLKTKFKGQELN